MAKKDFHFYCTLRVRWSECDAQGIVFAGSYVNYIEVAQGEYFRNLGLQPYDPRFRAYFDTSVVKTTLEYKAPARLDDVLHLYTRVSRVGTTSMTQQTEIYRQDSDELLTRIEMVYVNYDTDRGVARPVPDEIKAMVAHFEATGEVLPIEGFPRLAPL